MKHGCAWLAVAVGLTSLAVPDLARAQSASELAALRGLAPAAALANSTAGNAALAANLAVTGAIQDGTARQPTLLPFAAQQQQALRDAFVTAGNAAGLADGLGSTLGDAYRSLASYSGEKTFTSVSPAVARLIAYTNAITASDSNAAKYAFANGTTDGKAAASAAALDILAQAKAVTDVFGKAYGRPAGRAGAGRFGNARPFQTEPHLTPIAGADYFGAASTNAAWLRGPAANLVDSPAFPSGHTTYGTMDSLLLALLVPARYPQQMTRAAEYGNDRILIGAHYVMDVIGGRTLALYDVAHLLAEDPAYVGQKRPRAETISDYGAAVAAARADAVAALETACKHPIAHCATTDDGRFRDAAANAAFYRATLTYGLPVVYPANAGGAEDVASIAPEAGHLLTAAFAYLTLRQADDILTTTEGPGGGFLDDGSAFGLYSRLDLYSAAMKAMAAAPHPHHRKT